MSFTDPQLSAAGAARPGPGTLAEEIVKLLAVETLSAESISGVLWVTGRGSTADPIATQEIERIVGELMVAGQVERIWRRGVQHYRALEPRSSGARHPDPQPVESASEGGQLRGAPRP